MSRISKPFLPNNLPSRHTTGDRKNGAATQGFVMRRVGKFSFRAATAAVFSSLEKRLVGALVLIMACAGTLHFISQDQAFRLRGQSEALGVAASNAQRADQLVKSVNQFRLATRLYLTPDHGGAIHAGDELTDAAMQIGDQVNMMRLSGMAIYDRPQDTSVFKDLDRQIDRITKAARDPVMAPAVSRDFEQRAARMTTLAGAIQSKANAARNEAFEQLRQSTTHWQMLVTVIGGITVMLVLLILFDLMLNILPALRRMLSISKSRSKASTCANCRRFRGRSKPSAAMPAR